MTVLILLMVILSHAEYRINYSYGATTLPDQIFRADGIAIRVYIVR